MTNDNDLSTTKRIDELNALEEAEAEEKSGVSITALELPNAPKAKILAALAWVHMKRTDPRLKFTDYATTHGTKDVAAYLFSSEAADAEEAAAAAAQDALDEQVDGLEVDEDARDPFPEEAPDSGAEEGPGSMDDAESAVHAGDRMPV